MKNLLTLTALALFAIGATHALTAADKAADKEEAKPKHKISDVMKTCMGKNKLCAKVASGDADPAEKKKLLEMFTALAQNKPPRGDAKSWKEKTSALVKAAQGAVDGNDGAGKALGKAANCAACHKVHKPPKGSKGS